jgi:glycine reductase
MSDARLVSADIEVARPGDSTRITTINDVIEPRTKVDGRSPGDHGR